MKFKKYCLKKWQHPNFWDFPKKANFICGFVGNQFYNFQQELDFKCELRVLRG